MMEVWAILEGRERHPAAWVEGQGLDLRHPASLFQVALAVPK
jgi:hypothetical protein